MIHAVEIALWMCVGAVVASYAVYPLSLVLLARFRRRHVEGDALPSMTLIVSAYNEASVIRDKVENSLALDYPAGRLEVMVVSDDSDDGTDAIVSEYAGRGVVLVRQEPRRGKSAGLTQFVPLAKGEIIVFSDANSIYEPDALRKLVRHFTDPEVGFVVGHQRYEVEESATYESESLYWRYETWIKIQESKLGSVVCGDGAIYAIRAALFEPLRTDDINDFILPLKIVVKGFRGIFDEEAVCYERTAENFAGEFRRKARIVNRSLRAVCRTPQALNPFRVGWFAVQLFFHKVLRWFVPFFLLAVLATSIYLAAEGSRIYLSLLGLQLACYGTALLRFVPGVGSLRPVYVASYFCMVNAAAAWGILGLLAGRRIATWRPERVPAERPTPTARGNELRTY